MMINATTCTAIIIIVIANSFYVGDGNISRQSRVPLTIYSRSAAPKSGAGQSVPILTRIPAINLVTQAGFLSRTNMTHHYHTLPHSISPAAAICNFRPSESSDPADFSDDPQPRRFGCDGGRFSLSRGARMRDSIPSPFRLLNSASVLDETEEDGDFVLDGNNVTEEYYNSQVYAVASEDMAQPKFPWWRGQWNYGNATVWQPPKNLTQHWSSFPKGVPPEWPEEDQDYVPIAGPIWIEDCYEYPTQEDIDFCLEAYDKLVNGATRRRSAAHPSSLIAILALVTTTAITAR